MNKYGYEEEIVQGEDNAAAAVALHIGKDITRNIEFAAFCETLAAIEFDGTLTVKFEHGRIDIQRIETNSRHDAFNPFHLKKKLAELEEEQTED